MNHMKQVIIFAIGFLAKHRVFAWLVLVLILIRYAFLYNDATKSQITAPKDLISKERFHMQLKQSNYYSHQSSTESSSSSFKNIEVCTIPKLDIWNSVIKKELKPIPVWNECKKHKPLTYIKDNHLFIDAEIESKYYQGRIDHCEFAPVLISAIEKES